MDKPTAQLSNTDPFAQLTATERFAQGGGGARTGWAPHTTSRISKCDGQTQKGSARTRRRREVRTLMTNTEQHTIVIERHDGLWRVLIHPDQMQMFGSREFAVAHAQQLACARVPASTVVVREPAAD